MPQMDAAKRLSKARTHLLLDHPWFGSLSLRLKIERDDAACETMGTDGFSLVYNEEYVNERSDQELVGLMAHEVSHAALLHIFRGKGKNWQKWNEACDLAINPLLRKEGFTLPEHPLEAEEAQFAGMNAEMIYSKRAGKDDGDKSGTKGWPEFKPGKSESKGGDGDSEGDGESSGATETDWKIAAEQAASVSKNHGVMGAEFDRALKATHETQTDWRTILRRFIENTVPHDYSWSHPNRRYISQGLYLPGVVKENLPRIGVAVDTSGSIDQKLLSQFANELTTIMHETRPESIDVIYVDTSVKGQESFTPDDGEVKLTAKGGGGTEFQPAIDHFKKDPPVCMIYLTDLYASQPTEPDFPVLWVVPEWQKQDGWFGETVRIKE